MRARIRPFALLVAAGFRSRAIYRLALLAGIVTNSVFGLIRASVLTATVAGAGGALAGYDGPGMLAYVWIGQALLGVVAIFPVPALAGRVRTGDIAVDFARPLDPQLAYLAHDLGYAAYGILPRALPTFTVGWLATGFVVRTDPAAALAGGLSVLLAILLSFFCRMALELLSFWFVEVRGFSALYLTAASFCSGLSLPIAIMPPWVQTVCHATPFPSMLQTPIDLLSGRLTDPGSIAGALATQLAWVLGAALLGRAMLAAGHRRLVVQGG